MVVVGEEVLERNVCKQIRTQNNEVVFGLLLVTCSGAWRVCRVTWSLHPHAGVDTDEKGGVRDPNGREDSEGVVANLYMHSSSSLTGAFVTMNESTATLRTKDLRRLLKSRRYYMNSSLRDS